MINRHSLISDIQDVLNNVHKALFSKGKGDAEWTVAIKNALVDLGEGKYRRSGRWIYASGVQPDPDKGGGEWLYDLCWLDYEDDDSRESKLLSVPLVVECEWGNEGDIKDDFEKLLLARADLRVMIFGGANNNNKKTADQLAVSVRSFSVSDPNDLYLLAGYESRVEGFTFFRIEGNGTENLKCID